MYVARSERMRFKTKKLDYGYTRVGQKRKKKHLDLFYFESNSTN